MGKGCLDKIECFHMVSTPESERIKVTGLNLFHLTASPSYSNSLFFRLTTQSL